MTLPMNESQTKAINPTVAEIEAAAHRRGLKTSFPCGGQGEEFLYIHVGAKKLLLNKTKTPELRTVHNRLISDKFISGLAMHEAGIPVSPKRKSFEFSEEDVQFLLDHKEIVVKPNSMDRGYGVSDSIRTPEELIEALKVAHSFGPAILEKQIYGREYRIFVIDGKSVAALERKPLTVVGDGVSSILKLVEKLNEDPRRGSAKERKCLRPINIEERVLPQLKKLNLASEHILEKGTVLQLSRSNHLDSGGVASDCTDRVHPHYLALAEKAAKLFSIDVAGIDLICPDLTQLMGAEDEVALLEVNGGPDILWHIYPSEGQPQPLADLLIQYLVHQSHREL